MLVIDLVTAASVLRREKWAAAMKDLMPKKPPDKRKKSTKNSYVSEDVARGGCYVSFKGHAVMWTLNSDVSFSYAQQCCHLCSFMRYE